MFFVRETMRTVAVLFVVVALAASTYAYTTSGNKIYDPNGKAILLRGICRPSTEWNVQGENIGTNDWTNMKAWGANVIRITMNQCYWNSNQGGYQAFIDTQVNYIVGMGLGVILDLHWSNRGMDSTCAQQNMPDTNSLTFWRSVAGKYKNNPQVIFELYNEPHDVSWSVWRDGGDAGGYTAVGMQALLNAVRNDAGASNAVIVNGLNWAFDLTGVPTYGLNGSNIIYGTHPYDFAGKQLADWPNAFGFLTKKYPVIATEFGNYNCDPQYYADFTNYSNANDISWTSWGWYVSGCSFPSIISDWSGTPSASGQVVKYQLTYGPKVPSGSSSTVPTTTPTTPPTGSTTTTKSAITITTTASSSSTKITVVVNPGTGQYWIHIDSLSGCTKTVTSLQFKDSSSGAGWVYGFVESWGPGWSWSPNRILVTPISLRLTASDNTVIDLTNVITSTSGAGSYLSTSNF